MSPHIDPKRPARVTGCLDSPVRLGKGLPGGPQETLTSLGQLHGMLVAGEQGDAEFVLKPGDPFGQRLLSQKQPGGSPAEMQFLGSRHERPDLRKVEIHEPHPRSQLLVVKPG